MHHLPCTELIQNSPPADVVAPLSSASISPGHSGHLPIPHGCQLQDLTPASAPSQNHSGVPQLLKTPLLPPPGSGCQPTERWSCFSPAPLPPGFLSHWSRLCTTAHARATPPGSGSSLRYPLPIVVVAAFSSVWSSPSTLFLLVVVVHSPISQPRTPTVASTADVDCQDHQLQVISRGSCLTA